MKPKTIYLTIFLGLVAGMLFQSSDFSVQAQPTPSARPYCTQCGRFFPNMVAYNAHFCPVHGIGCPGGGGGGGNTYSGPTPEQIAAQQAAAAQRQREEKAAELDKQGVNADNAGDFETAINYYQKALEILPNNIAMQQHLDDAQQALKDQIAANVKQEAERLARAQEKERQFQKNKAEALNEMKGIGFDSAGGAGLKGLDDAPVRTGTGATANDSGGLKPLSDVNIDTRVVDARNVPSGLPKEIEDGIPHTPAGNSLRKGYEAILNHDWPAALAFFKDARDKEPNDPGLQRLIELGEFTIGIDKRADKSKTDSSDTSSVPTTPASQMANPKAITKYEDYIASKMNENLLACDAGIYYTAGKRFEANLDKYIKEHPDAPKPDWAHNPKLMSKIMKDSLEGKGYSDEDLKNQLDQYLKDWNQKHPDGGRTWKGSPKATYEEDIIGGKG